ncbi:hypothetical protein JCM14450A_18320 [Geobacillus stearothermophilus]
MYAAKQDNSWYNSNKKDEERGKADENAVYRRPCAAAGRNGGQKPLRYADDYGGN